LRSSKSPRYSIRREVERPMGWKIFGRGRQHHSKQEAGLRLTPLRIQKLWELLDASNYFEAKPINNVAMVRREKK
jgi:hypothetical protein